MDYTLKELLDIPRLRELLDSLDEIHSMPSAIIDTDGKILTATAWQDICTKFHRMNPDTEKKCIESDRHIEAKLDEKAHHVIYRCPMGLVDAAIPIVIEGKHLGNVFTGQLFTEAPDETYFINQARQYGFDENTYMAAMRKVPLFSEDKLLKNLSFIHSLTQTLAEQNLQYKRQGIAEKSLRKNEEALLALKETLQGQNLVLQINEKSLRRQNAKLTAVEETLRVQIDEYKTSQNLLRESEERFKALHDASFGGVVIHDKGLILDCNQGLSDMTGFTHEELVGMNGLELIAPDSLDLVLQNIKSGYAKRYEVEGVRKDGSVYPLSIKGKNVIYKRREVRVIEFLDITSNKLTEKALRESEERFRLVFESNPDPVVLAALEGGGIIDVNKAFETATGVSRIEALGHNSADLGLWSDKGLRESFLDELKSHGEINNFETEFQVKGGQSKTGLLSARLLKLNNEPCILVVIRDITTEKEAERALIKMDQMKSEFISMAAHELNTPLSAIMGYTELLRIPKESGGFTETQRQDFLNEVYDRGEALSHIIDDLLDVSRIESGRPITLDLQKTDFVSVQDKTVQFYQLHDTGHIFQLKLPDGHKKSMLLIDQHRINQVLENLFSNAMKYSPEGTEITLVGKMNPEGWEIRVEDQGIGMKRGQLDHVFDKFYRADASNTAVSGLGLGMSIAKQIIEAHGGRVRVESFEAKGTTVIFNLPCVVD